MIDYPRMNMKSSTFAELINRIKDLEDDLATCDKDLNNVCEQKEELYEENSQLKELLTIATDALKCYKQENWTYANVYNYIPWNEYTGGWCHAEKALEQIKEKANEISTE